MNTFAMARPQSIGQASELARDRRWTLPVLKAGGMDLLDHMKEGLSEPDLLIDVRKLARQGARMAGDRVEIGAGMTLGEIARDPTIVGQAPVLAQSARSAATPQVRNVASAAGNLLQRPRCWYYRGVEFHCLKKGGGKCYALHGENKYHAIFGGDPCYIVHPSNLAPALVVLDGTVKIEGAGEREVALADLFHLPSEDLRTEHGVRTGEVVTSITFGTAPKSGFYAIKEKQSFDWPLVFACVALEMEGTRIGSARVCAGAVAPVPWRLGNVEKALVGVDVGDEEALKKACAVAGEGAEPMTQNAYKVRLLGVAVRRAVRVAAEGGE